MKKLFIILIVLLIASSAYATINKNNLSRSIISRVKLSKTIIGVAANNNTLRNDLVSYWSFDGSTLGTSTVSDLSGNNNQGVLQPTSGNNSTGSSYSGPLRTVGRIGQALSFDGLNDYVNVSDSNSLDLTSQGTISAWVYTTGYKAGGSVVSNYLLDKFNAGSNGNNGYHVLFLSSNSSMRLKLADGASTNFDTGANFITHKQWTHAVVTFDGTTVRFFKNGAQFFSTLQTRNAGANGLDLIIGKDPGGTGRFFGTIDDLRIYNRALNSDEIKRLYNTGR